LKTSVRLLRAKAATAFSAS